MEIEETNYNKDVENYDGKTNLVKSGVSDPVVLEAELDLTLVAVLKLNSTGLVRTGLTAPGFPPDVSSFSFLPASLFLKLWVSIMDLMAFWPWLSLALYLLITSGVRAMAAVVLPWYLASSGVLAPLSWALLLVPSLLGAILASLGLFLALATAAST